MQKLIKILSCILAAILVVVLLPALLLIATVDILKCIIKASKGFLIKVLDAIRELMGDLFRKPVSFLEELVEKIFE